jgi:dimeric dUTPase (all-alpha-NTP-PPase superfamily)
MKNIKSIFIALVLLVSAFNVKAQTASVNTVVSAYLEVKNALVASDGSLAAAKAKALLVQITAVKADPKQQATWKKYADKLSFDARHISEVDKLDHQREHFAVLSSNLYQLVKALKPNAETLYMQYCPMKKASWLSNKKDIENPYYGEEMLSCGGVKETLAAAK